MAVVEMYRYLPKSVKSDLCGCRKRLRDHVAVKGKQRGRNSSKILKPPLGISYHNQSLKLVSDWYSWVY